MKKLLIILLISIITCKYNNLKDAYSFLEKEGFLEKIKKFLFISGKKVAEEKCISYLSTPLEPIKTDSGDILLPEILLLKEGDFDLPIIIDSDFEDKEKDTSQKEPSKKPEYEKPKPPVVLPFVPLKSQNKRNNKNPKMPNKKPEYKKPKPPVVLPYVSFENDDKEKNTSSKEPSKKPEYEKPKPPVVLPFVPFNSKNRRNNKNQKTPTKKHGNGRKLFHPTRKLDEADYELPEIPVEINNKDDDKLSNRDICKRIIGMFK